MIQYHYTPLERVLEVKEALWTLSNYFLLLIQILRMGILLHAFLGCVSKTSWKCVEEKIK